MKYQAVYRLAAAGAVDNAAHANPLGAATAARGRCLSARAEAAPAQPPAALPRSCRPGRRRRRRRCARRCLRCPPGRQTTARPAGRGWPTGAPPCPACRARGRAALEGGGDGVCGRRAGCVRNTRRAGGRRACHANEAPHVEPSPARHQPAASPAALHFPLPHPAALRLQTRRTTARSR